MASYSQCIGCGNTDKGRQLAQCKNCGRVGCRGIGIFPTGGCWTSTKCYCGSYEYKILGRIG
jgi:hypothetical protein